MRLETIGVLGGGAWGTALAQTQAKHGRPVIVWARNGAVVAEIAGNHTNAAYLPGVALDPNVTATSDLAQAASRDIVLLVAPAQHVRALARQLRPIANHTAKVCEIAAVATSDNMITHDPNVTGASCAGFMVRADCFHLPDRLH